jgi:hypothetical protein
MEQTIHRELVLRTERLRDQVEVLRQEINELRQELLRQNTATNGSQNPPPAAKTDCLTTAMSLAQDLGPEFSSEHPHDLAGRGNDWFSES